MEQETNASQHHSHPHEHHEHHEHGHEHGGHEHQAHPHHESGGRLDLIDRAVHEMNTNRNVLIALFAIIIIVAIFLRIGLLRYPGLFEPDGYYYYAVIKATLANHMLAPKSFSLSGFPVHNPVGEAPGLLYISAVGYTLLSGLGVTVLQVMRWMPVLFGVLTSIVAYFLVRYLVKSRIAGVLAALFVATSAGNLARTTALVYRGDTFISVFMVLCLVFIFKTFEEGGRSNRRYIYGFLAGLFLSLGVVFWNGAPFMTMVYITVLIFVMILGFIKLDREMLSTNLLLAEMLFVGYFLEHLYGWLGLARTGLLLIDTTFFVFYIPILAASFWAWWLAKNSDRLKFLKYPRARMMLVVAAVIALVIGAILTFNFGAAEITNALYLTNTKAAQAYGGATNSTLNQAIGNTTQELQKASFGFLFTSFAMQLFLAPIGVVLYILSKRRVDAAFLGMLAYLLITVVLQAGQIRFNAVLSVPMAVFAAYGAYAIGQSVWKVELTERSTKVIVAAAISILLIAAGMFKILPQFNGGALLTSLGTLSSAPFALNTQAGLVIEGSIIIEEALIALTVAYLLLSAIRGRMQLRYAFVGVVLAILVYGFYSAYGTSITSTPADGVNSQFLTAMVWMSQNTPANSTVLTIWPDGSVVEAVGNRQSYTDSVGGENGTKIQLTSQWLFNTTANTSFLYSIGRPNYLVTRDFWFQEIAGLATEGLVQNQQSFGYQLFQGLNVTRAPNQTIYNFYSSQPPYYQAEMIVLTKPDGTRTAVAFLGVRGSTRFVQLSKIILYNGNDYNYSIVYPNSTAATLNYTLLVSYTDAGITGGSLLGSSLVDSNLFNLVIMCNQYACPVNNDNVTYQLVYINNDTRIFKLNYK